MELEVITSNSYFNNNLFEGCTNLTSIDASNFNALDIPRLNRMFSGCTNLTSINLTNFNISKVTNLANMFQYCRKLKSLDVSSFDTNKVANMCGMFCNCNLLIEITGVLDLSSCTNVYRMFENCDKLRNVHLKNVPRTLDFEYSGGIEGTTYIIDNYID